MLEAPTANVWWREGDTLLTPSLDLPILAGVTRAVVAELAPAAGYAVEEGPFLLDRLLAADEVFLCSSIREVMPVTDVDAKPFELGPAAHALQRALTVHDVSEKVRLGGMALANGVLVHGPTSWACAIRHPDGHVEVASARKRFVSSRVRMPLLRGPFKLVEALAVLPEVKRKLPAARMPMQDGRTLASVVGTAIAVRGLRESRLRPAAQELVASLLSLAPAALALRGGELAAYHGAEHISIGTYEHGEGAKKEHERCGGHLVGPLLLTSAVGNAIAATRPRARAEPGARRGADRRPRRVHGDLRLDDAASS